MKITDVKVEVIHIPMKKPFRIAFAVQDHSVNVLVKVMTDEGIYGIGEAAPFEPVTGENSATVLEVLKLFKQGLIGMDPMNIEGIHLMMDRLISGNTSAKAAIDIALYDLKGKVMNQPLYKVLGGYRDQIVTDMTIGIDKPELMAQEAKERVERDGFRILKVKAGINPADDIRALTLIREAVGPDIRLRVDANQGYTVNDAVRVLNEFEKIGVDAVEQCLPWWQNNFVCRRTRHRFRRDRCQSNYTCASDGQYRCCKSSVAHNARNMGGNTIYGIHKLSVPQRKQSNLKTR